MSVIEEIKARIKQIFQKIPKKVKKGLLLGGLVVGATGLAKGCGTEKEAQEANNIKIEQENFKDQLKHKAEKDANQAIEQSNVEKANQLKTPEKIEGLLKDMYLKQREKETGDTTLKAENIKILEPADQSYVYVNEKTGDIITHGEKPDEIEQKLKRDGISYTTEDGVQVYKIVKVNEEGEEEKVLDCITLQSKNKETVPVKVIIAEQYDEDKSYQSVLTKMGTFIPYGVDYADYLEEGNENDIAVSKRRFLQAIKKFENAEQNQNTTEEKTEENPEEGFEPAE